MNNPFKKILTNEKVPEILRDKVINDVALIKLTLDVTDLFAIKYPGTFKDFFTDRNDSQKSDKTQN